MRDLALRLIVLRNLPGLTTALRIANPQSRSASTPQHSPHTRRVQDASVGQQIYFRRTKRVVNGESISSRQRNKSLEGIGAQVFRSRDKEIVFSETRRDHRSERWHRNHR